MPAPRHRWQVLADSPGWHAPAVVSRHATEGEAPAQARRLNGLPGDGRPLYFVELWETSNVLDVEHSATR